MKLEVGEKNCNHMDCKKYNQIVLVYMISTTKASMLTLSFKLGSPFMKCITLWGNTFCDHLGSVTMLGDYNSS